MAEFARSFCAAAAIVRRGEEVLLVSQQSEADAHPVWTPPSGRVHVGEMLDEAALRELTEETGLAGTVTGLAYLNQTEMIFADRTEMWTAAGFHVTCDPSAVPTSRDPDRLIREARFVSLPEARLLLADNPARPLIAPLIAHLDGVSGTAYYSWQVDFRGDHVETRRITRVHGH
jgi:ADP-ribose pyrophosphatase YjhB (NUDIX family)